ncbi:MAG: formamidopyrimidine-DNA glycosylase [Gemmatimonadota bacterium]|nr:MAG: formamidopyrimidine-DNA glycosylase [Gemmatimonadota bacterium]
MPELPDLELYLHALRERVVGESLDRVILASPFLLRSVDPPLEATFGRSLIDVMRLGKRIVFRLEEDYFLVIHLMIAGRLRWRQRRARTSKGGGQATFLFSNGSLLLTEAGTKRRASLHAIHGEESLSEHDRGGLEILTCDLEDFGVRMRATNHTLKRALCDPSVINGVGNAYSDEILHAARLSPFKLTRNLDPPEVAQLFAAARETLRSWTERLIGQSRGRFPAKVTAFRPEMKVHGKYGAPCPDCGSPIQRIVYRENEANYCPTCQTEGRLLKDRALSRLLKSDWPCTLEELEERSENRGIRGNGE